MTTPTPFKLLVLGAIDLLSLGSTKQHQEQQMELIRVTRSREEYFREGAFRVSPELKAFLASATFDDYDGIIICHFKGWGLEIMKLLPPGLESEILVVDRVQAPEGYPLGMDAGIYSDCWGWIRSRVISERN